MAANDEINKGNKTRERKREEKAHSSDWFFSLSFSSILISLHVFLFFSPVFLPIRNDMCAHVIKINMFVERNIHATHHSFTLFLNSHIHRVVVHTFVLRIIFALFRVFVLNAPILRCTVAYNTLTFMPCKHKYFDWLSAHHTQTICFMPPAMGKSIEKTRERIKRDCLLFYSKHLQNCLFARTVDFQLFIFIACCRIATSAEKV